MRGPVHELHIRTAAAAAAGEAGAGVVAAAAAAVLRHFVAPRPCIVPREANRRGLSRRHWSRALIAAVAAAAMMLLVSGH